jgi:hypothetical protein
VSQKVLYWWFHIERISQTAAKPELLLHSFIR